MKEVKGDGAVWGGVGGIKNVDDAGDLVLVVDAGEDAKLIGLVHGVLNGPAGVWFEPPCIAGQVHHHRRYDARCQDNRQHQDCVGSLIQNLHMIAGF